MKTMPSLFKIKFRKWNKKNWRRKKKMKEIEKQFEDMKI
jgi:hypothetical protein